MNTNEFKNLTPYEFENHCLSLPESYMRFYLPGMVVCSTPIGYHYFELENSEREHFRYGEFVDFAYLEECTHIPETYKNQIQALEAIAAEAPPLPLAVVAYDKAQQIVTLYAFELDTYFIVARAQLPAIAPHTLQELQPLETCAFPDAFCIELLQDGHIAK